MKKKLFLFIIYIFALLAVPYTITMAMTGVVGDETQVIPYDGRIILLSSEKSTQNVDYSEYLVGYVARNLISFDESVFDYPEFIKLNCILANTVLTTQFPDQSVISDDFLKEHYINNTDLETLWGEEYTSRMELIKDCISQTYNQVIYYENAPVKPYYHFVSNGMTRAYEDGSCPYLKIADTNKDLEEKGFLSVISYTLQDFITQIETNIPNSGLHKNDTLKDNIQIISRDSSGYVTKIQIGNVLMSGDDFINLFHLNSPSFTITFQDEQLKIITKGTGHGYGISLSYALRLAKQDKSCEEIISYFYENVEIKNCHE